MINTDFLCEKRLAELNPFYHTLVRNTALVLCRALEKYKLYFSDFTDHTILHSLQVLDFCNRLMGETALQLNADELYVLIMSAYLHDSGMGISKADYEELYRVTVSTEYRLSHPHDNVKETIRSFHQTFSKNLIYKYADLFDIPTKEHVRAIALVSEAHRKSDLYSKNALPSVLKIPGGETVRLPYLAALIRLADELDIAADRNLCLEERGQDTIFKMMHRSILRLHVKEDSFVLDVDADDPALFDGICQEVKKLEETLLLCADVVKKRTPFCISQNKLVIHRVFTPKKKITVLDTDLGTDDACALLLLKILPVQPDYIVATYGNTSAQGALRNALLLKKYLCLSAKVVAGLPAPLGVSTEKNDFHGSDGLAGCSAQMAKKLQFIPEEEKDFMPFSDFCGELKKADAVTYITIGSLCNLARILEESEIPPRFSGIYVMGGGLTEFNCSHDTEFNFSKNPEGVKKLLSAGLNITLFPLDVTNRQRLSAAQIDELEAIGSYPEYIAFLRHNCKANTAYNQIPAAVLHDTLPLLYLAYPQKFTLRDMRIEADEYGHIQPSATGEALHICTAVEENLVWESTKTAFLKK